MLVPTTYQEALLDTGCKKAIDGEVAALHYNHTWNLTTLPSGKEAVGYQWVYAMKFFLIDIESFESSLDCQGLYLDFWD